MKRARRPKIPSKRSWKRSNRSCANAPSSNCQMLPLLLRHDKIKVIFPGPGYCLQPCKYYNIILYSNILSHYRAPYNIHIYILVHIITFMHFWLVLRVWLQCKQDQRYLNITNWLWVKKTNICVVLHGLTYASCCSKQHTTSFWKFILQEPKQRLEF